MTIERDEELRKVAEAAIGEGHDSPYSVDFSRTFRPSVALELLDRAVNAEEAVRRLSAALEKLSRLGNGDRPGNSTGNVMAQAALSDPIVKRAHRGGKEMTTIPCPSCNGTGFGGNFLLRGKIVTAPCSICGGATYVSVDVARWIKIGAKHRLGRVAEGVSIHERAAALGITPARLSAMENGRADPAMLEGK